MFCFGVSSSTAAAITTTVAAGSTRILCATIFPHSSHFSSHLLPTTSVFSFLPLQIIIIIF
jgi:hypothetical protein